MTMIAPFMTTGESLQQHTSFRIGGPAELFFRPDNSNELVRLVTWCRKAGLAVRILGMGTNLLIRDEGVAGAVIATAGLDELITDGNFIFAQCGAKLQKLVMTAAAEGLSGLEPLAGIPGSLGGAIKMNAGTPKGCIGDLLDELTLLRPNGQVERLQAEDVGLAYRCSNIGDSVVMSARLRLQRSDPMRVRNAIDSVWARKRSGQPTSAASAGCVFKNPQGGSAGKILDSLGLKGAVEGDARISDRHANFIVNRGAATAAQVLALIDRAQRSVADALGVKLELEVEVW